MIVIIRIDWEQRQPTAMQAILQEEENELDRFESPLFDRLYRQSRFVDRACASRGKSNADQAGLCLTI